MLRRPIVVGGTASYNTASTTSRQDTRRARELFQYIVPDDLVVPSDDGTEQLAEEPSSIHATLQPYCQLVAMRCRVSKVMLNVMDFDTMYFLCQASTSSEDSIDMAIERDPIARACSDATPLKGRVCELTIRMAPSTELPPMFTVPNLAESIFKDLPVVKGPPYFRFYAGTPITTKAGINIGSLAVLDSEPRQGLTPAQESFLGHTAAQIMSLLETNRQALEGKRSLRLGLALKSFITGDRTIRPAGGDGATTTIPSATASEPVAYTNGSTNDSYDTTESAQNHAQSGADLEPSDARRYGDIDENAPHSAIYSRAAKLLRQAFGDLGEDGSVSFLSVQTRVPTHSSVLPQESTDGILARDADPTTHGGHPNSLISVLATSSGTPHSMPKKQLRPIELTVTSMIELMRRYPDGRSFTLDDSALQVSSDEENTGLQAQQAPSLPRSSRAQLRLETLRIAFPYARQLLFVPLWNADLGMYSGAVFIAISADRYFMSPSADLTFLHSFCCSVMAECSRLDAIRAEKQKVDFVGTISHEMRSPLHGILAGVEFLTETPLNAYQQSLIDTVQGCGNTLLDTINHVLDFSKVNLYRKNWQASNRRTRGLKKQDRPESESVPATLSGAPTLLPMPGVVEIAAVVEEVVGTLVMGREFSSADDLHDLSRETRGRGKSQEHNQTAPQKDKIQILLDIQKADWVCMAQPGAIRRIVLNLTGNALKYTTHGKVTIRLEQETTCEDSVLIETMRLTISDTGKGIGKRFLETKLFTPFAQENALSPGTGLGLSIVQTIVTLLGGHIKVSSEVDKGTTIQVTIPMKRPARGQISTTSTPQTGHSTASISSQPDTTFHLLQDLAPPYRVKIAPSRQLDLGRIIRHYVNDWCQIQIAEEKADIVIVDEDDLGDVVQHALKSSGEGAILLLCDVGGNDDSNMSRFPASVHIELLSKPVGPYKLARGMLTAIRHLDKLRKRESQALYTGRTESRDGQAAFLAPVSGSGIDGVSDDSKEARLATAGHMNMRLLEQATENMAISQLSMNAQELIVTPQTATSDYSKTETPFPGQQQEANIDYFPSLQSAESTTESNVSVGRPTSERGDVKSSNDRSYAICPRILVVDDNKVNLNLLRAYLIRKRKYTNVDSAEDGKQAVDAFTGRDNPYDIIFMDVSMPIMNGFEATRAIRAHENCTNGALIIALTGLASGRDQSEAFDSGMDVYLTKPVSFKAVGELLDNWESYQHVSQNSAEQSVHDLLPAKMAVADAGSAAGALAGPLGLFHKHQHAPADQST